MEKNVVSPLRLDTGYSSNWKPYAASAAIINEASTLHERVAYCWGLANHIQELSSLLNEHTSPDIARVSGLFYDNVMPLVGMLDLLGSETRMAEHLEAKRSSGGTWPIPPQTELQ